VTSAIIARGLTKRFGATTAVDAFDLRVGAAEIFGLVGPNGAGKTTAIRMLLGLVYPTEGQIELLGTSPPTAALARVGAIVEAPAFWGHLSGRRNLEYLTRAAGRRSDTSGRIERIGSYLEVVGLEDAARTKVRAYSQGMRQRLAIALALLGQPDVLILDEPTNGLDPRGIIQVRELLQRERARGTAIVLSSHRLSEVRAVCDRIGFMSRGRLVAERPVDAFDASAGRTRFYVDDRARAADVISDAAGHGCSGRSSRACRSSSSWRCGGVRLDRPAHPVRRSCSRS
jgi:ABC-type multidrug transport system ATPase subunit